MSVRLLALVVVILMVPAAHARAAMFDKDYAPCGEQSTTIDMVACTMAKTKQWDARLNTAYKALGQVVDAAQQEPLRAAQRLWIQYRDANCQFYAAHEGSIHQVLQAECMRSMTQERALELEEAAKP